MNDKGIPVVLAIIIAVAWFLATAVIDAAITVWIFKKYGGCPINNK